KLWKGLVRSGVALLVRGVDELIDLSFIEDDEFLLAPIRSLDLQAHEIAVLGAELLHRGCRNIGRARIQHIDGMNSHIGDEIGSVTCGISIGIELRSEEPEVGTAGQDAGGDQAASRKPDGRRRTTDDGKALSIGHPSSAVRPLSSIWLSEFQY